MTYNIQNNGIETSTIKELTKATHHNLVKLDFGEITVTSTDDHPYFTKEKGWCSLNPLKTQVYKNMGVVNPLQVGDEVYFLDSKNKLSFTVLKNITYLDRTEETYTIVNLDNNYNFFANRLLVGTEEL